MDLLLRGKNAVVTGASTGIGLACARELIAEGVHVAIVARPTQRLVDAASALHELGRERYGDDAPRVVAIAADLADGDEVARAAAETLAAFGHVDILINNAGAALGGPFLELRDDAFQGAWNLKLLGYIRMTRALLPGMIAHRDGRIVNVIGGAARTPLPHFLTGSTANAALLNFTRGLAKDVAAHNVRINAISPGLTLTERAERLLKAEATGGRTIEQAREGALGRIPMRRLTLPEEIAAMAALIVSDRMASMTGGEVVVDGGAQPGV